MSELIALGIILTTSLCAAAGAGVLDAHDKDRMRSLLVELVDRVAALEAAAAPVPAPSAPAPLTPAPDPRRLWVAMHAAQERELANNPMADQSELHGAAIRAVIHAIADWLELRGNHGSAAELRQVADHCD